MNSMNVALQQAAPLLSTFSLKVPKWVILQAKHRARFSAEGEFRSSLSHWPVKGRSVVGHVGAFETQVFWDALSKPQGPWAFLSPSEHLCYFRHKQRVNDNNYIIFSWFVHRQKFASTRNYTPVVAISFQSEFLHGLKIELLVYISKSLI